MVDEDFGDRNMGRFDKLIGSKSANSPEGVIDDIKNYNRGTYNELSNNMDYLREGPLAQSEAQGNNLVVNDKAFAVRSMLADIQNLQAPSQNVTVPQFPNEPTQFSDTPERLTGNTFTGKGFSLPVDHFDAGGYPVRQGLEKQDADREMLHNDKTKQQAILDFLDSMYKEKIQSGR